METEERFQEGIMRALWEQLNQQKWLKTTPGDRDYVFDAFNDLTMEDIAEEGEDEAEQEQEQEEEGSGDDLHSEHYDTDEEEDDVSRGLSDGNQNSQLAVGYKHDRSFVVRGSKIGIFKHTPQNGLEFSTSINKVATPKGKLFEPKRVSSEMLCWTWGKLNRLGHAPWRRFIYDPAECE